MNEIAVRDVVPFLYRSDREIRTAVGPDDGPWFVLADLCAALELRNVTQARNRLDQDEVATTRLDNSGAGNPNATIVSEAGMYELVLTSRTPEANTLRRWITHEVLPTIRRTGQYLTEEAQQEYAEHVVQTDRMLSSISRRAPQVSSSVEALRFALLDEFLIPLAGTPAIRAATAALPPAGPA